MAQRPDDGGVLMDDYPRIQRRPEPPGDPENQRRPRLRTRLPRQVPWKKVGALAGIALAGFLLGWCVHPDATDSGGPAKQALATAETRIGTLEGELAAASGALAAEKATTAKFIEDRARDVAAAAAATQAIADKLTAVTGAQAEIAIA